MANDRYSVSELERMNPHTVLCLCVDRQSEFNERLNKLDRDLDVRLRKVEAKLDTVGADTAELKLRSHRSLQPGPRRSAILQAAWVSGIALVISAAVTAGASQITGCTHEPRASVATAH